MRRWRSAILLSPLALFSKAKKHFVTITYQDKDKVEQAVVLEFDKDDIRMVLASLKARTLQTIVMQDEEAKKDLGGTSINTGLKEIGVAPISVPPKPDPAPAAAKPQ